MYFFSSVTVYRGFGDRASNHTSLLSTCQRIYSEALELLAQNVTFSYASSVAMLDHLTALTYRQIQEIRFIQAVAFPIGFCTDFQTREDHEDYPIYQFADILPLFPGLQLNFLEIEDLSLDEDGHTVAPGPYDEIDALMKSNGWKKLHYFTGPAFCVDFSWSDMADQPAGWHQSLQARDGQASGAYVEMYSAPGVETKGGQVPFQNWTPATVSEGPPPTDGVDEEEILVIAKRGRGAAYAQDGGQLCLEIRDLFHRLSWPEIKAAGLYSLGEDRF